MRLILAAVLLLHPALSPSAQAHWEEYDVHGRYLFGYASVGDNPWLYMPEVEGNLIPTNVQSLSTSGPLDNLVDRISHLNSRGQRAVIVLDDLLFIKDPKLQTPCGAYSWRQRLNYQARLDDWLRLNGSVVNAGAVAALIINTEINNRCISTAALDEVARYVTGRVPTIPAMAGYGQSQGAQPLPETVPASVAGVLFYRYVVLDPRSEADYQATFRALKSKLSPSQRIILAADGFYGSGHASAGWPKWYLGRLALNYMEFTKSEPAVVGLMLFLWPGFHDELTGTSTLGTRDLPQSVRDRHRQVGCGLQIQSPVPGACD